MAPLFVKHALAQAGRADSGTGEKISGIERRATGLDENRIVTERRPVRFADADAQRQIDHDREQRECRERRQWSVAHAVDDPPERGDRARRDGKDRSGDRIEEQQHPEKPGRSRRPWARRHHVRVVAREVELLMVVAVVGDRHQHEDRNEKGRAEAEGAAGEIVRRAPARQAGMHEQAGDEEHAGHEEAVAEQHHEVEAEPAHAIAADAEMRVVDDGVVEHDEQGDEGARAVERNDAVGCVYRDSLLSGVFSIGGSCPFAGLVEPRLLARSGVRQC